MSNRIMHRTSIKNACCLWCFSEVSRLFRGRQIEYMDSNIIFVSAPPLRGTRTLGNCGTTKTGTRSHTLSRVSQSLFVPFVGKSPPFQRKPQKPLFCVFVTVYIFTVSRWAVPSGVCGFRHNGSPHILDTEFIIALGCSRCHGLRPNPALSMVDDGVRGTGCF